MNFEKAVVISVVETPDRLAEFHQLWGALNLSLPLEEYVSPLDSEGPTRGCWVAHTDVMKSAEGPVLILEDDVFFTPGFTLDVEVPVADWDLLYFGGKYSKQSPEPCVHEVRWALAEHAYAVREPQKLAAKIGPPVPDRHIGWYLGHKIPRLKRYAVDPQTVGQRAGMSSISGNMKPERMFRRRGA